MILKSLQNGQDAIDFIAPTIIANGTTPLGKGVNLGLKKLGGTEKRYKDNQIPYNRPWIFIIIGRDHLQTQTGINMHKKLVMRKIKEK